jgi:cbb3-type cytochrome oxidase maturation protein
MEVMYFMIPIAILLVIFFVIVFIWATRNGQFEDLDTPAKRMLFEDKDINTKLQETKRGEL